MGSINLTCLIVCQTKWPQSYKPEELEFCEVIIERQSERVSWSPISGFMRLEMHLCELKSFWNVGWIHSNFSRSCICLNRRLHPDGCGLKYRRFCTPSSPARDPITWGCTKNNHPSPCALCLKRLPYPSLDFGLPCVSLYYWAPPCVAETVSVWPRVFWVQHQLMGSGNPGPPRNFRNNGRLVTKR